MNLFCEFNLSGKIGYFIGIKGALFMIGDSNDNVQLRTHTQFEIDTFVSCGWIISEVLFYL